MEYCSRIRHDSVSSPGVVFVTNKMNEMRRVTRDLAIADLRQKLRMAAAAFNELSKDASADPVQAPAGKLDALWGAYEQTLHLEWYPAWIRWGLHSIENLTIDGKDATVDTLLSDGPPALVEEIFKTIQKLSGIGVEQAPNSPEPGTSGVQAAGATSDSTATSAGKPDTTANPPQAEKTGATA